MLRCLTLLSLVLMCIAAPASASVGRVVQFNFAQDLLDSGFPNPERGFYDQDAPLWLNLERSPQDVNTLRALRGQGISMLRWYFLIDEFRSAPLTDDVLAYIRAQFAAAREAGMKVIPRFAYNFPSGGTWPFQDPDAPLDRVLFHIGQLEPVLRESTDVIAFMEIGFVGAWGEWHSSTNRLVEHPRGLNNSSRAIIDRLLLALPPERMIAMRYPLYKLDLYGNQPLTPEQAFSGGPQARMGAHNDCFLASDTDYGTYPGNSAARESLKNYLSLDNRFVPQGGETCNAGNDARPYIGCANALADLTRLRYTTLNIDYQEDVLQGWRDGGCFTEIADRLGYRFHLTGAALNQTAVAGGVFDLSFTVVNDGFASPYNPRGLEVVLRSASTGELYRFPLQAQYDPRTWLPDLGEITVNAQAELPASMPPGRYDVLLALPDPHPALYNRPEYAIRLANRGMWESQTGLNRIGVSIDVTSS